MHTAVDKKYRYVLLVIIYGHTYDRYRTDLISYNYVIYHSDMITIIQVYKPDAVCTAKAINIEVRIDKMPSISEE